MFKLFVLCFSRPPDTNWGYQPPPPVITEQPKPSQPHFPQYERGYPNTLESLAEKVHSFGMGRRMSAGGQPVPSRSVKYTIVTTNKLNKSN